MKKLYSVLFSLILLSLSCAANGFSDSTKTRYPGTPDKQQYRTFSSIDGAMQHFTYAPEEGFNEGFFDHFPIDPKSEEMKSKAKAGIAEVESSNNYVDYLTPSDLNQLPIGMKKKVGNSTLTIAVSNATFTSRYAELTVFARLSIPQSPKEIFFGISGLKLSKKGGIIGGGKLALLGDLAIPINNGNAALVLKGGFDIQTGLPLDQTFIEIDCNGFKKLQLSAEVQFPRSLFVPVTDNGEVIPNDKVKCTFGTTVTDWNDITANVSFATKFQINGLKGVDIGVTNAVFDFSDLKNEPTVVYPAGYKEKYVSKTNPDTWRGVYAKNISITLPNAFKNKNGQKISFGVTDLLIDNNGVTGSFFAENVLNFSQGSASGWPFSVDSIRIGIEANSLRSAGFGGSIGLPISQNDSTRKLGYSAFISASGDYICTVRTKGSLGFDFLQARTVLLPNSYVTLKGNGDKMDAEAMLNGYMNISLKKMDSTDSGSSGNTKGEFKDIEFQQLNLKTTAPYFSVGYFGYNGDIKLANFPVFVDSIRLTAQNGEANLGFRVNLNLQNGKINGSTDLTLVAKMNPATEDHWRFSTVRVNEITVAADFNAFKMNGNIQFVRDYTGSTDGFKGHLNVEMKAFNGMSIEAWAVFGNRGYRYWFFDVMTKFPVPIPVGPIQINGFGGGAFYSMKRVAGDPSSLGTPYDYEPDSTAGLGLRASVLFKSASEKLVEGRASMEVGFNKGGGVRYMGIYGYVHLLSAKLFNPSSGLLTELTEDLANIEHQLETSPVTETLIAAKMYQPSEAAKTTLPAKNGDKPGETGISAYLGIMCDFENKTFTANFDLYVNVAGGLLRGIGDNNRAGHAIFYIGPNKWYLRAGTPTQPIGVQFGIGQFNIRTTAYFMLGHDLPQFPDPPQRVLQQLKPGQVYHDEVDKFKVQNGEGVAFGAGLSINTGDMRLAFLYARFEAGIGFDIMFAKSTCANRPEIGVNGWYAQGQAYAYLYGEAGVQIKLGPIKKKINIISGGAACLLQAKLPNPTWVGGDFAINVNVLGGLIRIDLSLHLSFGEKCEAVATNDPGSDYDNFKIVSSITPAQSATNITVIARPQVNFMIKPGRLFELHTDNGDEKLMPKMEYLKLVETATGTEVEAKLKFANDTSFVTLIPTAVLNANTGYKIKAYFTYQQFKNGIWVALSENGNKVEETAEQTFTTGNAVDTIPYQSITHMYPFIGQKYFYSKENVPGDIALDQTFNFGYDTWKVFFRDQQGNVVDSTVATNGGSSFTIARSLNLLPQTNYTYEMWGYKNDGSKIMTKPIIKVPFRTSKFETLASKIQSLQIKQGVIGRLSSDVINLQADLQTFEPFDRQELVDGAPFVDKALISGTALMTDNYYLSRIKTLIYPNLPLPVTADDAEHTTFPINRPTDLQYIGVPPSRAITVLDFYMDKYNSSQFDEFLTRRFPFAYDLPKFYNNDLRNLQAQILSKYLGITIEPPSHPHHPRDCGPTEYDPYNPYPPQGITYECDGDDYYEFDPTQIAASVPWNLAPIVETSFPFIFKGNYPVTFKLNLPGNPAGASSATFTYNNPIE